MCCCQPLNRLSGGGNRNLHHRASFPVQTIDIYNAFAWIPLYRIAPVELQPTHLLQPLAAQSLETTGEAAGATALAARSTNDIALEDDALDSGATNAAVLPTTTTDRHPRRITNLMMRVSTMYMSTARRLSITRTAVGSLLWDARVNERQATSEEVHV